MIHRGGRYGERGIQEMKRGREGTRGREGEGRGGREEDRKRERERERARERETEREKISEGGGVGYLKFKDLKAVTDSRSANKGWLIGMVGILLVPNSRA